MVKQFSWTAWPLRLSQNNPQNIRNTHPDHLNPLITVHKNPSSASVSAVYALTDATILVCGLSFVCVKNMTTGSMIKVCWAVYP